MEIFAYLRPYLFWIVHVFWTARGCIDGLVSDEDMTSIHMTMLGEPYGGQGDQRGCPKQEEGPKLIRFGSPRWRPKSSSSPSWPPGPVCLKLVTQDAFGLRFR